MTGTASSPPTRVAIVGCGVIAPAYTSTLAHFPWVEIGAVADGVAERAATLAATVGCAAKSLDDVLADPSIDAVVNLTPPLAHHVVSAAALDAGKAVLSEKPLAVTFDEGRDLVARAAAAGVRLGCAPDTFFGTALQTARAAIDRGDIGTPVGATAFMLGSGPEWWHPDPRFFYKVGAGPLLDMGPYYLTALVQLLGPATTVTASATISRPVRTITSAPLAGTEMAVEVPTHVTSLIGFASGAQATVMTSFDVQASRLRNIEIYGTDGTLAVPDPNMFEGRVEIRRFGDREWIDVPSVASALPQSRGLGLVDMLDADRSGRPHRANADLALHVLEMMDRTLLSAADGVRIDLTTSCDRSAPVTAADRLGVAGDIGHMGTGDG